MSRSTISTFQLFEMFPDKETARTCLEGLSGRRAGLPNLCLRRTFRPEKQASLQKHRSAVFPFAAGVLTCHSVESYSYCKECSVIISYGRIVEMEDGRLRASALAAKKGTLSESL